MQASLLPSWTCSGDGGQPGWHAMDPRNTNVEETAAALGFVPRLWQRAGVANLTLPSNRDKVHALIRIRCESRESG